MSVRPTFTWLGHSTVRCDLPDGRVVLVDAWVDGNPACPDEAKDLERVDALLLTHGHFDHIGDAVALARTHEPEIVVGSFELCHWLEGRGVENTSGMNLGGAQRALGLTVTMVRADHSSGISDGDRIVPGGPAAGYVVETPDGYTFYHAGDTALFSDMRLIGELWGPELAFLPIGDLFTMDPRQAAIACELLGVREVVPVHWGTFPALTGRPEELERALEERGVDCRVVALEPGGSH